MEHLPNGVCFAAFFNGNFKGDNEEEMPRNGAGKRPWPRIRQAIANIDKWPTHDLFTAE
jgi:hypothetical protein